MGLCQTAPCACHLKACGAQSDVAVVIVAGGSGERFGDPRGKALVPIAGRPLVAWSLLAADKAQSTLSLTLVCRPQDRRAMVEAVAALDLSHPVTLVDGGATRQESCQAGIMCVSPQIPFISVQDGARPLTTPETFDAVARRVRQDENLAGAIAGWPVTDTIKRAHEGIIESTQDRSCLWSAQTPQLFRAPLLREAYRQAASRRLSVTDDASVVEAMGLSVALVSPQRINPKLTVPDDFAFIEAELGARSLRGVC